MLVRRTKPSTSRWSQQWAISAMEASTSGQRKRGEQAEPSRVVDDGPTTVLVHLACEVDGDRPSPRCTPGDEIESSDVAMPSRSITSMCSVGRPLRDPGHPVRMVVARPLQSGPVAVGDVVGVDVDLHSSSEVDPLEQGVDVEVRLGAVHGVADGRERAVVDARRRPPCRSSCTRVGLQVGHRAEERPGLLVDDAEVVGEQHVRHLDAPQHPLVVTRAPTVPVQKARPHSGSYSFSSCDGSSPIGNARIHSGSRSGAAARIASQAPMDHWSPRYVLQRSNIGPMLWRIPGPVAG